MTSLSVRTPPALDQRPDRTFDSVGLWMFYVLTLLLTWAAVIPMAVTGTRVGQGEGWWPTHMPALLMPMVAAVAVTAARKGRAGLRDLFQRMIRWRVSFRWWLAAVGAPLAFLAIGLIAYRFVEGAWPVAADFGKMTGLPAMGLFAAWALITLINGFGEETGWRGFLLPELQRKFTPLMATLVLIPMWALWHVPYFFVLTRYLNLGAGDLVGFVLGLASGAVVLTWLTNRSSGSVLLPTVWHGTFNLVAATAAAVGIIGAVVTTLVMVQAGLLILVEWRVRHRGLPSIFAPTTRVESFSAMNHLVNPFVRILLRSPLGRVLGRNLLLLTYPGNHSGILFEVPVGYVRDGNRLWVLVARSEDKRWWRNLRGGAEVGLHIGGHRVGGHAVALEGTEYPSEVAAGLGTYLTKYPRALRSIDQPPLGVGEQGGGSLLETARHVVMVRIDPHVGRKGF